MEKLLSQFEESFSKLVKFVPDANFYYQIAAILISVFVSFLLVFIINRFLKSIGGSSKASFFHSTVNYFLKYYSYFFPIILILALGIIGKLEFFAKQDNSVIRLFQSLSVLILVNVFISNTVVNKIQRKTTKLLLLPIAFFFFIGWLDEISAFLETFKMSIGNITVTLNGIVKTSVFGILLFWLGRASNAKAQKIIRSQESFDLRTRELLSKLFEIFIFVAFFIVMLQIIGIDLTTLAIFGGAVGVGLGLGLQSIASNFISGIIILMDGSLSIGDHIELEDGKQGFIRALTMRSATIETYDGKDILVPNEKFISSTFVNWTHANQKQRYSINLQVSYKTDLHKLFDILRSTVSKHPQVLSGDNIPIEEKPDAEISSFGDSGVNILIEYWMEGIDDGKNRVGADLLLMIWDAFKENDIEIPYPQREINILNKEKSI